MLTTKRATGQAALGSGKRKRTAEAVHIPHGDAADLDSLDALGQEEAGPTFAERLAGLSVPNVRPAYA